MKRVIFIGQAMPRIKTHPHDWPSLNKWLYSIGLSDSEIRDNFYYSALVDYFPGAKNGSHRVPSKDEIVKERSRLAKTLVGFKPEIVVPIGCLSIAYCLGENLSALEKYIGKSYFLNPYNLLSKEVLVIPLPHPSGASTWCYRPEGKRLLSVALELLKANLY